MTIRGVVNMSRINPYQWFSALALDAELSSAAIRLAACILALGQAEHGLCWRNRAELERASAQAPRTYARRLAELELAGYIVTSPRFDGGGERLIMLCYPGDDPLDVVGACAELLDGWGELRVSAETFKPSLGELAKMHALFLRQPLAKNGKRPANNGNAQAKNGKVPANNDNSLANNGEHLCQKWQAPLYIDHNPTEYLSSSNAREGAQAPQAAAAQSKVFELDRIGGDPRAWFERQACGALGWTAQDAQASWTLAVERLGERGALHYAAHKLSAWARTSLSALHTSRYWQADLEGFKPSKHPIPLSLMPQVSPNVASGRAERSPEAIEQAPPDVAPKDAAAALVSEIRAIVAPSRVARILRGDLGADDEHLASDLKGCMIVLGLTPRSLAEQLGVDLEQD